MDAERWRGQFVGALRGAHDAEALHQDLVSGIQKRQWTHLQDEQGKLFRDFDAFCAAQVPFGLAQAPDVVRSFLNSLLGSRQTDLLLVAPSRRGIKDEDPTSRHRGGKSGRQEDRLRAISYRTPEPVLRLCALGILPQRQAERLGRSNPTGEERASAQEFARSAQAILTELGDDRSKKAIAAAKAQVGLLLPPSPDSAEKVIKRLQKLSAEEQEKVRDWLLKHRGAPMQNGVANDIVSIPADPSPQEKSPKEKLLTALIKELRVNKARAEAFVASLGERIDAEPLGALLAEASRQLC